MMNKERREQGSHKVFLEEVQTQGAGLGGCEKQDKAGCSKVPFFNFEGRRRGRFCAQHKVQSMVDVKRKRCEQAGCSKQPRYNFEGERRGKFCAHHKVQGMVDVKSK